MSVGVGGKNCDNRLPIFNDFTKKQNSRQRIKNIEAQGWSQGFCRDLLMSKVEK